MSSLHRGLGQQQQQQHQQQQLPQHQQQQQAEGMVEMILKENTDEVISAAHTIGSQWQSAQNDLSDRCLIVDRIGQVVVSMEGSGASWRPIERLRDMVFTLERNLYVTAPSKEDYMNPSTLEERVHAAATKLMPSRSAAQQQPRRKSPQNNDANDADDYGRFSNAVEDDVEIVEREGSGNVLTTAAPSSSSAMLSPGGRGRGVSSSRGGGLSPQPQRSGNSPRLAAAAGRDTPSNNSASKGDDASSSSNNKEAGLLSETGADADNPYLYASALGGLAGFSMALSSPPSASMRNTAAALPFLSPGGPAGSFPRSIVSDRPLNERLSDRASSLLQLQSHMANAGVLSNASRFGLGYRMDAEGRLGSSMENRVLGAADSLGRSSQSSSLLDKKKPSDESGNKKASKSMKNSDDGVKKGHEGMKKKSRKLSSRDDDVDDGDAAIRDQKRKRLKLLCHGCLCFRSGTTCKDRKCHRAVELWQHVRKCNRGDGCDTPHCRSSQEVLRHFRQCRNNPEEGIHCKICSPFIRAAVVEAGVPLEGRGSARL